MIVLRPCAVRYKFQLCTGFTRPFWPVRCRQRKAQDSCQNGQQRLDALFRTSPTKAPLGAFFYELRFTRGDVVILSLLPQSGILSPRRPANCGAVRPIHRIVDNVAISLYNINTYSYSMRLAEKGDFIDEF